MYASLQKRNCCCSVSHRLVVVTIQKTYIYELCSLRKQQEYLTAENEYGLVAINSKAIVIPGKDRGALRILVFFPSFLSLRAIMLGYFI